MITGIMIGVACGLLVGILFGLLAPDANPFLVALAAALLSLLLAWNGVLT